MSKVEFYRNDILYKTITAAPWEITESQLGQDTYTYHARAYDFATTPAWAESGDFKIWVQTAQFIKMGASVSGQPSTTGPDQTHDHTAEIQAAVDYLSHNGGTLVFPCSPLENDVADHHFRAIYNISDTIIIPSNVTLQGESSERTGKCEIRWYDVKGEYNEDEPTPQIPEPLCTGTAPDNLKNKAMFRIRGNTFRVRFKDLALQSAASGAHCIPRELEYEDVEGEYTTAIEMNPDVDTRDTGTIFAEDRPRGGNISDVIFENVSISDFTNGIKAVSDRGSDYEISNIKIRGYQAVQNYRQLFIDSPRAYDWDVQNLNISAMARNQGGVEIVNAGTPSRYTGDKGKLKFLQLNCNGNNGHNAAFCVEVSKHAGLYFRQLHHEGVNQAIITTDLAERGEDETNPEPIVMESSIATGKFYDASMNLYLIGNTIYAPAGNVLSFPEDGRLRFFDAGVGSKVVDCGDYHKDFTTPSMLLTHSERNRGSFFAENGGPTYIMPHTICPRDVSGVQDIYKVGGDFFDSGVLPDKDEPGLYSNTLNPSMCNSSTCADQLQALLDSGGTVYIDGTLTLDHTVTIPKGAQIVGSPNAVLILSVGTNIEYPLNQVLFRINIPATGDPASSIAIGNLKLKTAQTGKIGLQMLGDINAVGGSKNMYFSGLTFDGFATGIDARPGSIWGPQIDGIALKDMTFTNDANVSNSSTKAIDIFSSNASNWNVMNLNITSNSSSAIGWNQKQGGYLGLQDVRCTGSGTAMADCINVKMVTGFFLNGLRKTVNVTNAGECVTSTFECGFSKQRLYGRHC